MSLDFSIFCLCRAPVAEIETMEFWRQEAFLQSLAQWNKNNAVIDGGSLIWKLQSSMTGLDAEGGDIITAYHERTAAQKKIIDAKTSSLLPENRQMVERLWEEIRPVSQETCNQLKNRARYKLLANMKFCPEFLQAEEERRARFVESLKADKMIAESSKHWNRFSCEQRTETLIAIANLQAQVFGFEPASIIVGTAFVKTDKPGLCDVIYKAADETIIINPVSGAGEGSMLADEEKMAFCADMQKIIEKTAKHRIIQMVHGFKGDFRSRDPDMRNLPLGPISHEDYNRLFYDYPPVSSSDRDQARVFDMNFKAGYVRYEENEQAHKMQPVERYPHFTAQMVTQELFNAPQNPAPKNNSGFKPSI